MTNWNYPDNPKLWNGSTVYIIGGGPSLNDLGKDGLKKIYDEKKKGAFVLGVNKAFTLMGTKTKPLCDAVFFGDNRFYKSQKENLKKFPGLKFTAANLAVNEDDFLYLYRTNEFFTMQPGKIGWANNSGNAAINLAVQLGAYQIVLVAFDMTITGKQTNWHKDNASEKTRRKRVSPEYYDKVVKRIQYTADKVDEMGINIINTNPDSALDYFIKVPFNKWINSKDRVSLIYDFDEPEEEPEPEDEPDICNDEGEN